jgi:hypothetical protein
VLKVDADEGGVGGDDDADALRHLIATKARNGGAEEAEGAVSWVVVYALLKNRIARCLPGREKLEIMG